MYREVPKWLINQKQLNAPKSVMNNLNGACSAVSMNLPVA